MIKKKESNKFSDKFERNDVTKLLVRNFVTPVPKTTSKFFITYMPSYNTIASSN